MDIMFLTSDLMEAARGQKHPSEAKNGMKESISNQSFSTTLKTLDGSYQI
jgi:hypothetical protein